MSILGNPKKLLDNRVHKPAVITVLSILHEGLDLFPFLLFNIKSGSTDKGSVLT